MVARHRGDVKIRGIGSRDTTGDYAGKNHSCQSNLGYQQAEINTGDTINHEAGTSGGTISPAAHGITGNHTALQSPVCQCRYDGHTIQNFLVSGRVFPGTLTDGLSGTHKLAGLAHQIGNQAEYHQQQQGQCRNQISKETGKLVTGQYRVVAAKPDQHDYQRTGNGRTVIDAFQHIGSSKEEKQCCFTMYIEQRVNSRHQQEKQE